jgi:4-diphosphocytidyl-2-C-methyl-D-erythritol kinase
MHLHKIIPMGAGLGGGSADGTFALQLLNDLFNLNITKDKLIQYALQLGSDCPFFIHNKPCFATSRGEIMELIDLDLSNYKIVVINPGIHISTAWAFSQLTPQNKTKSIADIVAGPIANWKAELINDFESPIIDAYPIIGEIKQMLYQQGAIYASMTGSGSSIFGLYPKQQILNKQMFGNQFRVDII